MKTFEINGVRYALVYELPVRDANQGRGKSLRWRRLKFYLSAPDFESVAVQFDDGPLFAVGDRDAPTFSEVEWALRDYYRWMLWYGIDPVGWSVGSRGLLTVRQWARKCLRRHRRWWSAQRRRDIPRGRWSTEDEREYRLYAAPWWRRQGRRLVSFDRTTSQLRRIDFSKGE